MKHHAQRQNLKLSEYLRQLVQLPQLVSEAPELQKQVRQAIVQVYQIRLLYQQGETAAVEAAFEQLEQNLQFLELSFNAIFQHDR